MYCGIGEGFTECVIGNSVVVSVVFNFFFFSVRDFAVGKQLLIVSGKLTKKL